jgi:hypothetical protein
MFNSKETERGLYEAARDSDFLSAFRSLDGKPKERHEQTDLPAPTDMCQIQARLSKLLQSVPYHFGLKKRICFSLIGSFRPINNLFSYATW